MLGDHATGAEAGDRAVPTPLAIQILSPVQHLGERG
jgi:hypothetical protein